MNNEADNALKARLGSTLRGRRLSIDAEALTIGGYQRLSCRVGRPVTQEEAAEALGISREWYSRLENGTLNGISRELQHRISETFRIPIFALRTRQIDEHLRSDVIDAFRDMRMFVKRLASASNFGEAADFGVQTFERIVRPDCATIASLQLGSATQGYAAGALAQHWRPFNNEIALEAHTGGLRDGGITIAPYVPLPKEAEQHSKAAMSFDRLQGYARYRYECDMERWNVFNRGLQFRSAVVAPLFNENAFAGLLAVLWSNPYCPTSPTCDVAEAIAGTIRLASIPADL